MRPSTLQSLRRVCLAAAVAACALAASTGCGPATKAQKVEEAQKTVRTEREPDKLLERGKMFARIGDLTRASQYFEASLEEGASEKKVLPLLMRAYVDSGRFRVAIDKGEVFLRRHPSEARLRFLVGTLYVAIGEHMRGIEHFRQVIATEPKHAPAHYALAVQLRDAEGDWVRADYHFRQYLNLDPNGPHAEEARASLLKTVQ